MKLQIKKRPFLWSAVNESGETIAKIRSGHLLGAEKSIRDAQNHLVYTTDIVNSLPRQVEPGSTPKRGYVIYQERTPIATAVITMTKGSSIFHLPRAQRMAVNTPYGMWLVKRRANNSVTVAQGSNLLASSTPFFSLKPVLLSYNGKQEASFWAAIYVLLEYMMHEDDWLAV